VQVDVAQGVEAAGVALEDVAEFDHLKNLVSGFKFHVSCPSFESRDACS
jgi:hypothetical protein